MKARYLYSLSDSSIDVRGGNKAKNLRYLMKHKYPVPKGFVLVYDALEQYENDPEAVLMHVRKELIENLHPELSYAARSSASLEDQGDFPAQEHLRVIFMYGAPMKFSRKSLQYGPLFIQKS